MGKEPSQEEKLNSSRCLTSSRSQVSFANFHNLYLNSDLKYPTYEDQNEAMMFSDKVLMDEQEITSFMAQGGYVWFNNFRDIKDTEINPVAEEISKKYKGMWKVDDTTQWEGIGTIQFSDGSVY